MDTQSNSISSASDDSSSDNEYEQNSQQEESEELTTDLKDLQLERAYIQSTSHEQPTDSTVFIDETQRCNILLAKAFEELKTIKSENDEKLNIDRPGTSQVDDVDQTIKRLRLMSGKDLHGQTSPVKAPEKGSLAHKLIQDQLKELDPDHEDTYEETREKIRDEENKYDTGIALGLTPIQYGVNHVTRNFRHGSRGFNMGGHRDSERHDTNSKLVTGILSASESLSNASEHRKKKTKQLENPSDNFNLMRDKSSKRNPAKRIHEGTTAMSTFRDKSESRVGQKIHDEYVKNKPKEAERERSEREAKQRREAEEERRRKEELKERRIQKQEEWNRVVAKAKKTKSIYLDNLRGTNKCTELQLPVGNYSTSR